MAASTDLKTVRDADGVPVLLIIKERNELLICEPDDINRNIKLRAAHARNLIKALQGLG